MKGVSRFFHQRQSWGIQINRADQMLDMVGLGGPMEMSVSRCVTASWRFVTRISHNVDLFHGRCWHDHG
jgi:hypothetical protein